MSFHINKISFQALRLGRDESSMRKWGVFFLALFGLYFAIWWMALRPGVFSYDSGYYIHEVMTGVIKNRKPFLYARFLQLTSINGRYFELSTLVQVLLIVMMLSRAFTIALVSRVPLLLVAFCAILVLNPYSVFMSFYIQNDILFCFGAIAILIETLNISRTGRVDKAGIVMIAVFSPMAFGFRENGLIFLPLWLGILPFLFRREVWAKVIIASILSTSVAYMSGIGVTHSDSPPMFYPAIIHEAIRLAQPAYGHPGGVLSPQTTSAIGQDNVAKAVPFYWSLYWDSIAFFPKGPNLAALPKAQKEKIVHSFLVHDLWTNLPSIAGHRLHMFLAAALARGEYLDPYSVPRNITGQLAEEKARYGARGRRGGILGRVVALSIRSRGSTWNAMIGLLVVVGMAMLSLWRRRTDVLLLSMLLLIQAAAIFLLAPAATYRYLFMLYLAPLLLLGRSGRPGNISCQTESVLTLDR